MAEKKKPAANQKPANEARDALFRLWTKRFQPFDTDRFDPSEAFGDVVFDPPCMPGFRDQLVAVRQNASPIEGHRDLVSAVCSG